jgi:uncharacterized protein YpmS
MRADFSIYWASVVLSALTLALVIAYVVLAMDNRKSQAEVNQRQQFINQSIQLGRVNEALARALAATATELKDDKLRDLLARNGVTINPSPSATPAAEKPQ